MPEKVFHWQPSASIDVLKQRAGFLAAIRQFFFKKNILEIETPHLSQASVIDLHIESIDCLCDIPGIANNKKYYLQTSPEFHMKRLLAAGSGSIYQIAKAFRQGERGRQHNLEFTLLEWYQLDFNHHQLMVQLNELLHTVFNLPNADKISYQSLFEQYCGINPLDTSVNQLKQLAARHQLNDVQGLASADIDTWLNLIMSHIIEPQLGIDAPIFVYDFPASQAALAKLNDNNPLVAERFELYIKGTEIANGFNELTDANEQRKRFEHAMNKRTNEGLDSPPIDEYFLSALAYGLPDCSGVALGIDRLMMVVMDKCKIDEVMSFCVEQA